MSNEDKEIAEHLVLTAMEKATERGLISQGLSRDMSGFLAEQLLIAVDMYRFSKAPSSAALALLLISKGKSTARLAVGERADCVVAWVSLGATIAQVTLLPGGPFVKAAQLLADVYSLENSCGISQAVQERAVVAITPAAIWVEKGIIEWMARYGAFGRLPH